MDWTASFLVDFVMTVNFAIFLQIKKEREHRRQREERKIQAILEDEPPPPWSPPNKTIPFGK